MSTTDLTLLGAVPVTLKDDPSTTPLLGLALTAAAIVPAVALLDDAKSDRPTADAAMSADTATRLRFRKPIELQFARNFFYHGARDERVIAA
jgi:hypothetical protein